MIFSAIQPARLHFDSQGTLVSCDFNDIYFSPDNGLQESRYVFIDGNQLTTRFPCHPRPLFVVAETGFGCGLNFLALWQSFEQYHRNQPQGQLQRLHMVSFEQYPLTAQDLRLAHHHWPQLACYASALQQQWPLATSGCHRLLFNQGQITLDLWFADINLILPQLDHSWQHQIDAWFLDGFAPAKNPAMWSQALYTALPRLTRAGGTIATFTAAGAVRRGLQQAGFLCEKRKGYGRKREMLIAQLQQPTDQPQPCPWYQRIPASIATATATNTTHPVNDIAIIGGGIASALLALALLRRGLTVTLYCADDKPAKGASGNRQGAVYPLISPQDPTLTHFSLLAFDFALRYYKQLNTNIEHNWCGVSQLAYDENSRHKISQILQLSSQLNLPPALLQATDAAQISEHCGLTCEHGGIEYPTGGWINPRQLTRLLLLQAEQQGLHTYYQHQAVTLHYQPATQPPSFHPASGTTTAGWQISFANGEQRQHPALVLANGWQILQFAQTAALPVTPISGQVSHVPTTAELVQLRQVLCYDGYLTPQNPRNHSHCLGSSHHRGSADACYRQQDQQQNRQRLIDCLAAQQWPKHIDISAAEAHYGVRCTIRDHLPLIGNAPDYPQTLTQYANLVRLKAQPATTPTAPYHHNLFILAALGSRGLCSAPLAAEILAAQLCGEPLPMDATTLHALNPNRIWIRKLLKGRQV